MERVARDGIVLEICPTSNLRTKAVRDVAELRHILATLQARGVPFTINTDGPEMLVTNIVKEYQLLLDHGIFDDEDVRRCIETASAPASSPRASQPRSGNRPRHHGWSVADAITASSALDAKTAAGVGSRLLSERTTGSERANRLRMTMLAPPIQRPARGPTLSPRTPAKSSPSGFIPIVIRLMKPKTRPRISMGTMRWRKDEETTSGTMNVTPIRA